MDGFFLHRRCYFVTITTVHIADTLRMCVLYACMRTGYVRVCPYVHGVCTCCPFRRHSLHGNWVSNVCHKCAPWIQMTCYMTYMYMYMHVYRQEVYIDKDFLSALVQLLVLASWQQHEHWHSIEFCSILFCIPMSTYDTHLVSYWVQICLNPIMMSTSFLYLSRCVLRLWKFKLTSCPDVIS